MSMNIGKELAKLKQMSVDELRVRYVEVFSEVTGARHKDWLIKRIAWRLQAQAEGGLSDRARQRAWELAREADLRLSPPRPEKQCSMQTISLNGPGITSGRLPAIGSVICRPYKGRTLEVKVLVDGFEYEGDQFASLSAVAKSITGSHCNGYHFFRLSKRGHQK